MGSPSDGRISGAGTGMLSVTILAQAPKDRIIWLSGFQSGEFAKLDNFAQLAKLTKLVKLMKLTKLAKLRKFAKFDKS